MLMFIHSTILPFDLFYVCCDWLLLCQWFQCCEKHVPANFWVTNAFVLGISLFRFVFLLCYFWCLSMLFLVSVAKVWSMILCYSSVTNDLESFSITWVARYASCTNTYYKIIPMWNPIFENIVQVVNSSSIFLYADSCVGNLLWRFKCTFFFWIRKFAIQLLHENFALILKTIWAVATILGSVLAVGLGE